MPTSNPQLSQSLDKLLVEHGGPFSIPPLKPEQSWLAKQFERLQEWLEPFLKPVAKTVDWGGALTIVIYAIAGMLALTLLWLLYKSLRRMTGTAKKPRPERRIPAPIGSLETDLQSTIASFLERGDLSSAARWRWKLFLFRSARPPWTTPRELEKSRQKPWEGSPDEVMFGRVATPAAFETLQNQLRELEVKRD